MNSDERLDGDTALAPRFDAKQFLVFAAIEADPNGSSVGWLQARLAGLAEHWRSGRRVTVFEPAAGQLIVIDSLPELSAWANRHFPLARLGPGP